MTNIFYLLHKASRMEDKFGLITHLEEL